jgi:putative aldouronate transport system substrate-binding protein
MVKQNRKWVAWLLVLMLFVTACSSGNSGNNQPAGASGNESKPQSKNTTGDTKEPVKEVKKDEAPTKLKIYMTDNLGTIPSGPSMNIPAIKYLGEKTNTDLEISFMPHNNYGDQLRLKFAAGEFPDVYQDWGIAKSELVLNDLALPLNDLLKEHGPDLLKIIPQEAWDAVTLKGQILGVPQPVSGTADKIIYVRKDWLDLLGLSIPKTPDEFLDMLRAFREKNPGGIDQNTLIPFSARANTSWMHNIYGMWGMDTNSFMMHEGEMIPGYLHPNMKEYLTFLKTMYDEKLIDSEFLTTDGNLYIQKITSGRVGSLDHIVGHVGTWNDRVAEVEGAEFIAIPTPKPPGWDGDVGAPKKTIDKTFILHKDTKNAAAVIRMLNWLVTDEGAIWSNLGLEGDTFKRDGSKLIYDAKKDKDQSLSVPRSGFNIAPFNKQVNDAKLEHDEKKIAAYMKTLEITQAEGFTIATESMPAPQSLQSNADLGFGGTLLQETISSIILGKKPLDYFDEFVKTWRQQGGEAVIKEVTDWYNANH